MGLRWISGRHEEARCPACRVPGEAEIEIVFSDPRTGVDVEFSRCKNCQSLFVFEFKEPEYDRQGDVLRSDDLSVKYYVEQGAGLETIFLPAMLGRERPVKRYLEIGCGFGFGLDFANRAFKWEATGIDPGALASVGRRQLNINIQNRYATENEIVERPHDIVVAVEVLEHFSKPEKLLGIMKRMSSDDGLLILTTPSANYIERGVDKEGMIAALSPGFHAVIFSEKGLGLMLESLGFREYKILGRGATLLVAIGRGARSLDFEASFDADIYRAFLEDRFSDPKLNSTIGIGYGFRLFKLLVNGNKLDDASKTLERLESLILRRDGFSIADHIDVLRRARLSPSPLSLVRTFPVCLPCIYFLSGIIELNKNGNALKASELFFAAMLLAKHIRRVLLNYQIDDGELGLIEIQGRAHAAMILEPNAPWRLELTP